MREPELSVVLWRRRGWDGADYARWSDRLLRQQVAFCTPSKWKGEPVARAAFLHPLCPTEFVEELLASME